MLKDVTLISMNTAVRSVPLSHAHGFMRAARQSVAVPASYDWFFLVTDIHVISCSSVRGRSRAKLLVPIYKRRVRNTSKLNFVE